MIRNMNPVGTIMIHADLVQPDYTVREEGAWLVVPVVMMAEGVHHGNGGPVLHLSDYYSRNPEAWDGVLVTAGHPQQNGEFVSVNSVQADQWVVGHLRNSRVEDDKLKADVYIHQQRAIAVNPEVVNYIMEGKKLEVSIGAFTHDAPDQGIYDGEEYSAVSVAYHPDHLALLPGGEGACSWADGCGIRTNKKGDTMDEYLQSLKEATKKGKGVANFLQTNQVDFLELASSVQAMLDRLDSDARIHFLKALYDDSFIYKVRDRDQGTDRHYEQDYSVNEETGEVDFEGDPTEVRMEVEYVPMQTNRETGDEEKGELKTNCGFRRTNFNHNKDTEEPMSEKEKGNQPTSAVMNKVVSLVNNERTRFTESDQDWLLQLNEAQLERLEPTEAPEPEVTREQAIQALEEDLQDIDKTLELLPEKTKAKVEAGLAVHKKTRETLIETIQTNSSKEDWPEEKLKAMDTETLQSLAKTVKPVDYSGQGPTSYSNGEGKGEGALLPVGVKAEAE